MCRRTSGFLSGVSCTFEKVRVDFGLMTGINRVFVIMVFLHSMDPSMSGIREVVRGVTPAVSCVASLYSLFVNPGMPEVTNFSIVEYHCSVSGSPKLRTVSVENRCWIWFLCRIAFW